MRYTQPHGITIISWYELTAWNVRAASPQGPPSHKTMRGNATMKRRVFHFIGRITYFLFVSGGTVQATKWVNIHRRVIAQRWIVELGQVWEELPKDFISVTTKAAALMPQIVLGPCPTKTYWRVCLHKPGRKEVTGIITKHTQLCTGQDPSWELAMRTIKVW